MKELLQKALEILSVSVCVDRHMVNKKNETVSEIKSALAQPEQEPVAFVPVHPKNGPLWSMTTDDPNPERLPSYPLKPLYTHPQPERKPLSELEAHGIIEAVSGEVYDVDEINIGEFMKLVRGVEAAHGIK